MLLAGYGQIIATDRPVPGAVEVSGGQSGITISHHDARTLPPAPLYAVEDGQAGGERALVFTAPGVAQYRCTGNCVEVTPHAGGPADMVEGLLIATALPATQWMQGRIVLHAAGIALGEGAGCVAITGPSGSGKSTIAAGLLDSGARLIGDDSLAIAASGAGWTATGLPGGLFLPAANAGERCFKPLGEGQNAAAARLDAVLVLDERGAQASLHRLGAAEAVRELIAARHRPRIPAALGLQRAVLEGLVGIARHVPVLKWRRSAGRVAPDERELDMLRQAAANGELSR